MADINDIIEQNKRLAASAYTPATPRLSAPKWNGPIPKGSLLSGGGTTPFKGDKGILGGIANIIPSAVSGIGKGIAALPQFVGKAAQTAVGLGEGVIDLGADLIDENLYTSRFETDLKKGRELGLKGDALVAYAGQRQYPLASMIIESGTGTARRVAELATGGAYDYGDPGIDYVNAFKKGNLGEVLVGDVGNVILAGRSLGLGNVLETAGASVGATAPRLGSAISGIGRAVEQPVGEATRLGGRLAESLGTKFNAPEAFTKAARSTFIDEATGAMQHRPIRAVVNALGESWNARNRGIATELFRQAAELTDQYNALPEGHPDKMRLANEIYKLREEAGSKIASSGPVKYGRKLIWKATVKTEREAQQIASTFRRMERYGAVPESPKQLRDIARKIREGAVKMGLEGDQLKAEEAKALEFERRAAIKEAHPEMFDRPLQPWVAGGAALVHIGLGRVARTLFEQGKTDAEIATILQDPSVIPTLENKGMKITPEMVQAARQYDAFLRGDVNAMNEGAALAMQAYLENYTVYSKYMTDAMRMGYGLPEGPMPSTYLSFYPEPKFLVKAMESWSFNEAAVGMHILDFLTAEALYELVKQGKATAEDLASVGITWKQIMDGIEAAVPGDFSNQPFPNFFKKVASADYDTFGMDVAALVSENAYNTLRQYLPERMMNPDIYPAQMRPSMLAARQAVRAGTLDDVMAMRDELSSLAERFTNDLPKKIVDAMVRDVDKVLEPGVAVTKEAWTRLRNRLETIKRTSENKLADMRAKGEATEAEIASIQSEIDQVTAVITQAEALLDIAKNEPQLIRPMPDEQLASLQKQLDDARTRLDNANKGVDEMNAKVAEQQKIVDDLEKKRSEVRGPKGGQTPRSEELVAARAELDTLQRYVRDGKDDVATATSEVKNLEAELKRTQKKGEKAQAAAVRSRLSGIGKVVEGEPVVGKTFERKVNDTAEQLRNKETNRQAKLKSIRDSQAAQEPVVAAATESAGIPLERPRLVSPDFLVGPELFDPAVDSIGWFPAGPTRGALPRSTVETQILGEGAGAQNEPSFMRQRRGGGVVLTPQDAAAKMIEVLKQMNHNATVEMLLKDPNITSSVSQILGEDWWKAATEEATKTVMAQETNKLRTPNEIESAIREEVGVAAIRELGRRGYEPVSRVEVDPQTGGHAAVGTLDQPVNPRNMDENTYVMKMGVKERLFSEYVKKGSRNTPLAIQAVLNAIGKGTFKWKSVILPFSARWQIGDAVSNVLNAWIRGDVPPSELIRGIQEVARRLKDPTDASLANLLFGDLLSEAIQDPVISALLGAGLQGRGMRLEEMLFTHANQEKILAGIADPVARTRVGKLFNDFRQKSFRLNEAHNTLARAGLALTKLEENLAKSGRTLDEVNNVSAIGDPTITKAIHDAVDATNDALGAFSDLTPWEKSVMRQIYPFWSWVKYINKAAMDLAIDSPDRVLFYSHLGAMAADPDQNGFMDFLRGKTPVGPWLMDLSFLNPYSDAMILSGNPLAATGEQFTSLNPAFTVPMQMAAELYYGATGRSLPILSAVSRPGYLEGRPGATTRDLGDILGGAGYIGLKGLGGPFRNVLEVLPTGTIPGTDVATGPGNRFPQGSLRTSGMYAEPRLSPLTSRLSAIGRTFGIPAPIMETNIAVEQSKQQAQRDKAARARRIKERRAAKK